VCQKYLIINKLVTALNFEGHIQSQLERDLRESGNSHFFRPALHTHWGAATTGRILQLPQLTINVNLHLGSCAPRHNDIYCVKLNELGIAFHHVI